MTKESTRPSIKIGGCLKNPPDHRDFKAVAFVEAVKALPDSVDLRTKSIPVFDQDGTSSCVANALASAFMYQWKKELGTVPPKASRMFIYWYARQILRIAGDNGCDIRSACKAMSKYGVPSERLWSFRKSHINKAPTDAVNAQAAKNAVTKYYRLDTTPSTAMTLNSIKVALQSDPVPCGIPVFSNYHEAEDTGILPMPTIEDKIVGYHAIALYGYKLKSPTGGPALLVRNSWGMSWGDHGDGYISDDYVLQNLLFDPTVISAEKHLKGAFHTVVI